MTQDTKSSGRKNKPTRQHKQALADFLVARGMKRGEAMQAAKVADDTATGESISAAIVEVLK